MIQLYSAGNENFEMNGNAVLSPSSCELTQQLNSTWELVLQNPLDDYFSMIVENAVIKCDIPNQKDQLFRIAKIEKDDDGVTAYAYPVFLDSADEVFLFDVRPTDKNGQEALDILTSGTKYSGSSNIIKKSTAYYMNKNLIEAINSDDDQSFIKRWGGEMLFNNYQIIINDHVGSDNGLRAEFGFNLKSISESIDMSSVATRLVPIAYNGYMLESPGYVDSEKISSYPKIFTKIVELSDYKLAADSEEGEGFETLEELQAAMIQHCEDLFESGLDLPAISYSIDMVDLSQTEEYRNYTDLTNVSLGDTVHCRHRRLGIETTARVVVLEFDCVTQTISNLTLGQAESSYFDQNTKLNMAAGSVIDTDTNTLIAEKLQGVIDAFKAQLHYQKTIAKKQDVRAILFEDLDPDSPTYGAMALGTLGFQIANKRTTDGSDWDWRTMGTANGFYADSIFGNEITGLTINGGMISGGTIVGALIKAINQIVFGSDDVNIRFQWYKSDSGGYTGVIISGNADMTFEAKTIGFSTDTAIYVDGYKTFDKDITLYNWDGQLIRVRFKKGMGWYYDYVQQTGDQLNNVYLVDDRGVQIKDSAGHPVLVKNGLLFAG